MNFSLSISVPGIGQPIRATAVRDIPSELAPMLGSMLGEPRRMVADHTLSTGDYLIARGRPPRHPVRLGSQASPLGKTELLCRLKPGDILYPGGHDLHFAYGPDNTEPLMARGPVVARVDDGCLDDFFKAGRLIWEAQYRHHTLVTITVSMQEAKH
jgi:hypothetical protein